MSQEEITYLIGDKALHDHIRFIYPELEIRDVNINIKNPIDFSDLNEISNIIIQLELKDRDVAYIIPLLKYFVSQTINIAISGFLSRKSFFNEIEIPINQIFYIQLPANKVIIDSFLSKQKICFNAKDWENCRNIFNWRISHIIKYFHTNDRLRYTDKINKMMINF